jgi:hypothetical protein
LSLLSLDATLRGLESSPPALGGARFYDLANPAQTAAPYQRSHMGEQCRSIGSATGFGMPQQVFEGKAFVELFPN